MLSSPYKNSQVVYSSIKQSLQRLGKDLVNGEYLVNPIVEYVVPLYELILNHVPGITQAGACMVTKHVHVPVQTKPVFGACLKELICLVLIQGKENGTDFKLELLCFYKKTKKGGKSKAS